MRCDLAAFSSTTFSLNCAEAVALVIVKWSDYDSFRIAPKATDSVPLSTSVIVSWKSLFLVPSAALVLEILGARIIFTSALLTFFSERIVLACTCDSSSCSLSGLMFTTRMPVLYDCLFFSSFTLAAMVGISECELKC